MSRVGVRRSNGTEQNKLLADDRPAHEWYRFVLSFPPHLVREYLTRFGLGSKHCVLDPFCGTGTTLVECKKLGVPSVGIEANPVAHFASSTKSNWQIDPEQLWIEANLIAEAATNELVATGVAACTARFANGSRSRTRAGTIKLRTLPPDCASLLLGTSISPLPLHKTLTLLECIRTSSTPAFLNHELLALAKVAVQSASNLHFGPEVGVGPPKHDAEVVSTWLAEMSTICADLRTLQANGTPVVVHCGDSREVLRFLEPKSVDAVITSPPYPNEKDYTRTTRLESVLLGFIKNKAALRELKRGLVRSNTRGVYKGDNDDDWVDDHAEVQRIANEIEARRLALGKTSGFERLYHRVTKLYFGGMARHLAELKEVLRPNAHLAYVVGDQASYLRVMIRTGQILGEIAVSQGFELVGIDLFRTRLATATREQLREEVVLLRWPGRRRRKRG
ncbi:MAG: DNA methyltransferase [Planctomycetes bacterium]|nr:DNA methyltransferase [Planctomycetota bacterium]